MNFSAELYSSGVEGGLEGGLEEGLEEGLEGGRRKKEAGREVGKEGGRGEGWLVPRVQRCAARGGRGGRRGWRRVIGVVAVVGGNPGLCSHRTVLLKHSTAGQDKTLPISRARGGTVQSSTCSRLLLIFAPQTGSRSLFPEPTKFTYLRYSVLGCEAARLLGG